MQAFGFYFFYSFIWLFTLLPLRVQYGFSTLLYFVIYYIAGYRREVVVKNLRNAFPEKTDEEISGISKSYFRHMCDELIEAFQLIHFSGKKLLKHVSFKNPEVLNVYFERRQSIVAVFGHYGNWEWFGAALPLVVSHKVLAIYRPLKNRYFDKMMISLRSKFGVHLVPTKRVLQEIICFHREGTPIMTLFLGDQGPAKKKIQYWTKFLNQDTPVFLGAEKVSSKLGHAVVYFRVKKVKRGKYEIEFVPLFDNPKETSEYEITEKHLKMLEEDIIQTPDYWLWSHRRWKHKRPVQKKLTDHE
jgi:Kdo2-lipid IVA lauroyltransferase/acyltransferase